MKFNLARGATSISVGGREYGGRDGIVDIPADHAADLARHDCLPHSVAAPPVAAGGRSRKAKG